MTKTTVKTKRFGNAATLGDKPDARLGNTTNPKYLNALVDGYWRSAIGTIQQFSDDRGNKLTNPRTVITIDDKRIYFDLIGDLVPMDVALVWFTEAFDSGTFQTNLRNAIAKAYQWWVDEAWRDHSSPHLLVTEKTVLETQERPG